MPEENNTKAKTSSTTLGLGENIEGLLAYAFGFVSAIIFLLIEKNNKFVRFHAMQSLIIFLVLLIIGMIPVLGWAVSFLLWPLTTILWIVLMVMAVQGKMFKLPIIGDLAEKYTK